MSKSEPRIGLPERLHSKPGVRGAARPLQLPVALVKLEEATKEVTGMGNRDKRDDKTKKTKKDAKTVSRVQVTDVAPPVEVVKKKRKVRDSDED